MNDPERTKLIDLMTQTWQLTGPKPAIWVDVLTSLDHAIAYRAYLRMRDTVTRASVADFLRLYRDVQNEVNPQRVACARCHGSGWITCQRAGYARPCDRCDEGKIAQRWWLNYVDERERNAREQQREIATLDVQDELL